MERERHYEQDCDDHRYGDLPRPRIGIRSACLLQLHAHSWPAASPQWSLTGSLNLHHAPRLVVPVPISDRDTSCFKVMDDVDIPVGVDRDWMRAAVRALNGDRQANAGDRGHANFTMSAPG